MDSNLKQLKIYWALFMHAFGRDYPFQTDFENEQSYLDIQTGEILSCYESDHYAKFEAGVSSHENKSIRLRVTNLPDRYLQIPPTDHGEHHRILQDFIKSDWTDNEQKKEHALSSYHKSIGYWIKEVKDESIVQAYFEYREKAVEKNAEKFLNINGIDPLWK